MNKFNPLNPEEARVILKKERNDPSRGLRQTLLLPVPIYAAK